MGRNIDPYDLNELNAAVQNRNAPDVSNAIAYVEQVLVANILAADSPMESQQRHAGSLKDMNLEALGFLASAKQVLMDEGVITDQS